MSKEVAKIENNSVANPYSAASVIKKDETESGTAVESQRVTIEVMTAYEVAKRFPRNMQLVSDKILQECSRPTLAELSTYSYSKGGTEISGPTIRLMEAIARAMGNIRFGWQCLESNPQRSVIRAYAYDLENNVNRETTFEVRHWRDTKGGGYAIKDEREIYELQANKAMRRVRGCLEGLVPRDVIDMALEQCDATNKSSVDTSPEGIKKLLAAFAKLGVNRAMIEESRQGLKMEAMKAPQIVGLRKNYAAIKDGIAKVEDIFDLALADKTDGGKKEKKDSDGQPDLKDKIKGKGKDKAPQPDDNKNEPTMTIEEAVALIGGKTWEKSDFPADEGKLILTDDEGGVLKLSEAELFERAAAEKIRLKKIDDEAQAAKSGEQGKLV